MSKPAGTNCSYSAPTLSIYGGVIKLTAAGSMGLAEGASTTNMNKLKP